MNDTIRRLFREHFGEDPVSVEPIAGQATTRARYRLATADGRTAIGVPPDRPEEDRAFAAWTASLAAAGLAVPHLYGRDETTGACLVEDAGRESLYGALESSRASGEAFAAEVLGAFEASLRLLASFQIEGARVVDFRLAWPRRTFDRRGMAWDLASFKNMLLRLAQIPFHEDRLEDDFDTLLDRLATGGAARFSEQTRPYLMHRDFQARNVLLSPRGPLFIDYQGGRRGSLAYDVASMLYSGSSDLPDAVRERLADGYLEALAERMPVDAEGFRRTLADHAVLRIIQALGAYGYRGLHLRRPGFASRIGIAARNLAALLDATAARGDLPEIRRAAARILAREDLAAVPPPTSDGLVVRVGSFAYPHGLPRDPSGHGGGYVFDCRALPNPGREERYRTQSGLDADVARLLEDSPEARTFVERALALVETQIEAYRERDFSSLDVRFGCTGGQHRSVWCAARLAEALARRHPDVRVVTEHAESDGWPPQAARP